MNNNIPEDILIGITLTKLRIEQNIEQNQLASKMGITRATISKIEKGQTPIRIDYLRKALEVLVSKEKTDTKKMNFFFSKVEKNGTSLNSLIEKKVKSQNENKETLIKILTLAGIGVLASFLLKLLLDSKE